MFLLLKISRTFQTFNPIASNKIFVFQIKQYALFTSIRVRACMPFKYFNWSHTNEMMMSWVHSILAPIHCWLSCQIDLYALKSRSPSERTPILIVNIQIVSGLTFKITHIQLRKTMHTICNFLLKLIRFICDIFIHLLIDSEQKKSS